VEVDLVPAFFPYWVPRPGTRISRSLAAVHAGHFASACRYQCGGQS